MKCLVDIWPVFTTLTLCTTHTKTKKKNGGADKIRKIQMRAPSAPSNTGGMRPFVTPSFFLDKPILWRQLPGSTYYICFAPVVFCHKQTAAEFECHRTQTTFSPGQSRLGRRVPHGGSAAAVSRASRQTDPRGNAPLVSERRLRSISV